MQNKNIIDLFLVIHTSIVLHLLIRNLIGSGHEIAHCRSCIAGHPLREMPTVCFKSIDGHIPTIGTTH